MTSVQPVPMVESRNAVPLASVRASGRSGEGCCGPPGTWPGLCVVWHGCRSLAVSRCHSPACSSSARCSLALTPRARVWGGVSKGDVGKCCRPPSEGHGLPGCRVGSSPGLCTGRSPTHPGRAWPAAPPPPQSAPRRLRGNGAQSPSGAAHPGDGR